MPSRQEICRSWGGLCIQVYRQIGYLSIILQSISSLSQKSGPSTYSPLDGVSYIALSLFNCISCAYTMRQLNLSDDLLADSLTTTSVCGRWRRTSRILTLHTYYFWQMIGDILPVPIYHQFEEKESLSSKYIHTWIALQMRSSSKDIIYRTQRYIYRDNYFPSIDLGAAGLRLQIRNHTTLLTYSYHVTLNGIHANANDEALNNYSVNVMIRGHLPSVSYIHTKLVPRAAESPKQANQTILNVKYYNLFAPS